MDFMFGKDFLKEPAHLKTRELLTSTTPLKLNLFQCGKVEAEQIFTERE